MVVQHVKPENHLKGFAGTKIAETEGKVCYNSKIIEKEICVIFATVQLRSTRGI